MPPTWTFTFFLLLFLATSSVIPFLCILHVDAGVKFETGWGIDDYMSSRARERRLVNSDGGERQTSARSSRLLASPICLTHLL